MRMPSLLAAIVLFVLALLAVSCSEQSTGESASEPQAHPAQAALDEAIDDERHAIAFYAAVMEQFGERRPFSRIIEAERRHEGALLKQYERLSLTPPDDAWADHEFIVPATFQEACDIAVVAEIKNKALYDGLISGAHDDELRTVFTNLGNASQERHLPAFRRHGSGWESVSETQLSEVQSAQRGRAFAARDAMFSALFAELSGAVSAEGPAHAIGVCSERAPALAEETSEAHGLAIGRTALRIRNPENQPPAWAQLLMDAHTDSPGYVADRSGRLGVISPIKTIGVCLQCHGMPTQLGPGVRDRLAELYPDDRATGYSEGELRGWFWIEVPAGDTGEG